MALEIKKPDEFNILFIGGDQLKKDTEGMVSKGGAEFIDAGSDDAKTLLADHPELQNTGDLAIVAGKEGETGEACSISQAGKSLIVHCEDFVLPVKDGD